MLQSSHHHLSSPCIIVIVSSMHQTVLNYLIGILWACLNASSHVWPRFSFVLDTKERVEQLCLALKLSTCSGFRDMINSAAPPTVKWFKSLSTAIPPKSWGIYVLVFEKRGHRALIYIGSGTDAKGGIAARVKSHRAKKDMPKYVAWAHQNNYRLTHSACLIWCRIPESASQIPRLRTVIVALEAAMTCILWALWRKDTHYGFSNLCPWTKDSDTFTYDGLCSHNPLCAGIIGHKLDYTHEQLEEMKRIVEAKNAAYQKEYQANLRAAATPEYKARQKANNEKQKPGTKARQQKAVEDKTYYCALCDVACRDNATLVRHNDSPRHKLKVQYPHGFICAPCNMEFEFHSNLKQHFDSASHIANTT